MNKINKKFSILVVEDEKSLADALKDKLEKENFDVIECYDGLEGLQFASTKHPDLILLDLIMPNMGGLEMLNKLREDSWGINAKVIVLTNVSDPANIVVSTGFSALGSNYEYLVKAETTLENLVSKVKEKLNIK